MATYPEVESIVNQLGRPDDATDTDGYYNSEYFVPLRPEKDWPLLVDRPRWQRWLFGAKRARTKDEIVAAMNAELGEKLPGITWNFSQNIRDNVMEALSGIKGDNSVKIIGPDLDRLEVLAAKTKNRPAAGAAASRTSASFTSAANRTWNGASIPTSASGGAFRRPTSTTSSRAPSGGRALSSMVEGEKLFDISVRWPKRLRNSEADILDIPVDIINNNVVQSHGPGRHPHARSGTGNATPVERRAPGQHGQHHQQHAAAAAARPGFAGRRGRCARLPDGQFERHGASTIYREQGKRLIAIKFSVRGRDLAGAVDEAQAKTKDLFKAPYRAVWSGEFEEMQDAEAG